MKLLLHYYHPIIFDLAESFKRICKVEIAINPSVTDNYGGIREHVAMIEGNEHLSDVPWVPIMPAVMKIRQGMYDLVGIDGVFSGDDWIIQACKDSGVPYFCINGYAHNADEPGNNILSLSNFLPQIQYKQKYPSEGHIQGFDWKNIAEAGRSHGKNILVFYPEMNHVKRRFLWPLEVAKGFDEVYRGQRINEVPSFIHRYEECNKWCYSAFEKVKDKLRDDFVVENFSGLSHDEVLEKIYNSRGLLHLKHGDCPGATLLEALIFGKPVFTMRSFVNACFNQEFLIDNFTAIVADDLDELCERIRRGFTPSHAARKYIWELTSFERQKYKVERFFKRCIDEV